jgi:uncharacterized protein with PIN domain
MWSLFRFYGPLNDFLPAHRRQRRFRHPTGVPTSVKDAIESLGVPHCEVDLIVVNGSVQSFGYRVRDGDDVSVYPAFHSIDIASLGRVGADPPKPVRFVLDTHLNKLASLLRLCGFDTIVLADDRDVADAAAGDARVALSRDVGLLKRSRIQYGRWVRATAPERQLAEIVERFDLADQMEPFTRCLRCNERVVAVEPADIAHRLPPRTRATFRDFRRCPGCGRIYWQGSHYVQLRTLVDRARQRDGLGRAPLAAGEP